MLDFLSPSRHLLAGAPVDDMNLLCAQPKRAAGRVHSHVAGTHHRHLFAHPDGRIPVGKVKGLHQVHPCKELVGTVYTIEVLTRDIHHDRQPGTRSKEHRVVLLQELAQSVQLADHDVVPNRNAQLTQIVDLRCHHGFGQPKLGDSIDEHTP